MTETHIAILILTLVLIGIVYCYFTSEGYKLKRFVDKTNFALGGNYDYPGLRLYKRPFEINFPSHAPLMERFIKERLVEQKTPDDIVELTTAAHSKLMRFGAKELEIMLAHDSGCWNYLVYVFDRHTVVLYVTQD